MACGSSPGRAQLFLGSPNLRQFISATNTTRSLPLVIRKPTEAASLVNGVVPGALYALPSSSRRPDDRRKDQDEGESRFAHDRDEPIELRSTSDIPWRSRHAPAVYRLCVSACLSPLERGESLVPAFGVAFVFLVRVPFLVVESSIAADFPLIARCRIRRRVFGCVHSSTTGYSCQSIKSLRRIV